MSDHHLIKAVEAGDLSMAEAFDIIKKGDDAHQGRHAHCAEMRAGWQTDRPCPALDPDAHAERVADESGYDYPSRTGDYPVEAGREDYFGDDFRDVEDV